MRARDGSAPVERNDLAHDHAPVMVCYRQHPRSEAELRIAPWFGTFTSLRPPTWRAAHTMPAWASRLRLEVVERHALTFRTRVRALP